jgi:hypothetical protein
MSFRKNVVRKVIDGLRSFGPYPASGFGCSI